MKPYYHWRCDCGAYGNSNMPEANEVVIALHRGRGHVVEIWRRGERNLATTSGRYADVPRGENP
jgi:hypothetical protein